MSEVSDEGSFRGRNWEGEMDLEEVLRLGISRSEAKFHAVPPATLHAPALNAANRSQGLRAGQASLAEAARSAEELRATIDAEVARAGGGKLGDALATLSGATDASLVAMISPGAEWGSVVLGGEPLLLVEVLDEAIREMYLPGDVDEGWEAGGSLEAEAGALKISTEAGADEGKAKAGDVGQKRNLDVIMATVDEDLEARFREAERLRMLLLLGAAGFVLLVLLLRRR